jgi:copper chaperone NosL
MKLSLKQRLVVALAAVILLPVFIAPLWTIRLVAPQYPEGMGMYIGVSEVRGHDEHDIQNINILNHYIGMKPIEPEGIPELDIFPPILAAIIVIGLIAAAVGRRWLVTGWVVGFFGLAVAGIIDFYLWMIDYGHNLDPMAAIKIPGMTYTPPLIGSKQLLNITASSYPHIGTLFLTVSLGLGAWVVYNSFRRRTGGHVPLAEGETVVRPRPSVPAGVPVAGVLAVALLLAGCVSPAADPASPAATSSDDRMVYGESADPYCGEVVQRVRWGGEIRTADGETLRFRSVECMAAYILEERTPAEDIVSIRAVDFPHGWQLIDVEEAQFLHTQNLASPARRKLNVLAIGTEKMAINLQEAYAGPLLGWDEVLHTVATAWDLEPPPACPFHAMMAVNN